MLVLIPSHKPTQRHLHTRLCVCIYVYIYIYIHTYLPTYLHTYIHTYILLDLYIFLERERERKEERGASQKHTAQCKHKNVYICINIEIDKNDFKNEVTTKT